MAGDGGKKVVKFAKAIIAAGSQAVKLPFMPDDERVVDSTGALLLRRAEAHAGHRRRHHRAGDGHRLFDAGHAHRRGRDARRPDAGRRPRPRQGVGEDERASLRPRHAEDQDRRREGDGGRHRGDLRGRAGAKEPQLYDLVLVAVGRSPNGKKIGAEKAGVAVTDRGFIDVDKQMRTNVPHIFAIGDIVGQPMLAHKAVHEAHVAAEAAHGEAASSTPGRSRRWPTPTPRWPGPARPRRSARPQGIKFGKAVFPWAASGRAIANGRDEGFTKLLFDEATHRVIGGGIVGTHAGDLIGEVCLAIEMGCEPPTSARPSTRTRRWANRSAWPPRSSKAIAPTCRRRRRSRRARMALDWRSRSSAAGRRW